MSQEFNPNNPEYKKVSNLPKNVQKDFVNIPEGGFVKKTAKENLDKAEKVAKITCDYAYEEKDKYTTGIDVLNLQAECEDREIDKKTK